MREGLETHSTSTTSTTSYTINNHYPIRERLKSYPFSNQPQGLGIQLQSNQWHESRFQPAAIACKFFRNISNISEVIPSPIEIPSTGYFLWREHCRRMGFKDSRPAAYSLCKYSEEIVACMVLTDKRRLGLDIRQETPKQAKSIGSMISTMWNMEIIRWQKVCKRPDCPLSPSVKETRHVCIVLFYD